MFAGQDEGRLRWQSSSGCRPEMVHGPGAAPGRHHSSVQKPATTHRRLSPPHLVAASWAI